MVITKRFAADFGVNEGERAVVAKINTAVLDRDGEVVLPAGCDASDFEKNPTVFFMHDYKMLPVGKCVSLKREGELLLAKTVFAARPATHPEGLEWLPDTLLSLYQQRVMNAFSIGLEPTEVRQPSKKDLETYGGDCKRVISKWGMVEYSCVTLGANQEAVSLAVSKSFVPTPAPDPVSDPVPDPAEVIVPKRYLYVVESAPVQNAPDHAGMIADAMAKARGNIYRI